MNMRTKLKNLKQVILGHITFVADRNEATVHTIYVLGFNTVTSRRHQLRSLCQSEYTKTLQMISKSFYAILVALSRAVLKL